MAVIPGASNPCAIRHRDADSTLFEPASIALSRLLQKQAETSHTFPMKKGPEGPWLRIRSLAVIDWLSTNHFLDRHFTQDAAVLDGAADRTILDTRNTGQLIHFGLEHLTARNGIALILIDTLTIA